STFSLFNSLIQVLALLIFGNFILYVSITVFINIVQNIYIARKADSMYPFINEKVSESIAKDEKKEILKNCYAIFLYKINDVILKATDNIVLSSFIGLSIVGIYSNYLLIVSTFKMFLDKIYDGVKDSIGNLHASADPGQVYLIFKVINFFTACIFGLASVGTFVVANEFISVWIGDKFVLSQLFALLIAIELYIMGLQKFLSTFRTSMGLFQQAKYRPVIGSILNVIFSIILVQYWDISGVIMGTILASLLTYMWYDPFIIYKHVFKKSAKEYYITNIEYVMVMFLAGGLSFFLSKLIIRSGVGYVIVATIISIIVTFGIIFVLYRKTKEFKYIMNIVKKYTYKLKSRFL
ncbi:MAG TPA: hypothetical protein GX717_06585, partial [Clostridiaceae bacterium]|nr:hypothetical protein [Clostridiaceae bacterium]